MRYVSTKKYHWLFEKWRSVGRTRNKSLGVFIRRGRGEAELREEGQEGQEEGGGRGGGGGGGRREG